MRANTRISLLGEGGEGGLDKNQPPAAQARVSQSSTAWHAVQSEPRLKSGQFPAGWFICVSFRRTVFLRDGQLLLETAVFYWSRRGFVAAKTRKFWNGDG